MTRIRTLDLVEVALGTALLAVCSQLAIPTSVPFTMQTFAVFCVLLLFGGGRGMAAIAVWLLLGAIGLPVFAEFTGGPGILFGATGGYLLGFAATAALYWLTTALCDRPAAAIAALVGGLLVCYAFGTAWFSIVYARDVGAIGFGTALAWCVAPFVLPDMAKLALAVAVSRIPAIRRHIAAADRAHARTPKK